MLGLLMVLTIALAIPFLGAFIGFAVVLFGLGALVVTSVPTLRRTQQRYAGNASPITG